jgi:hypothetical protein
MVSGPVDIYTVEFFGSLDPRFYRQLLPHQQADNYQRNQAQCNTAQDQLVVTNCCDDLLYIHCNK